MILCLHGLFNKLGNKWTLTKGQTLERTLERENKRSGDSGNEYRDVSALHGGPEEAQGTNTSFFPSVKTAVTEPVSAEKERGLAGCHSRMLTRSNSYVHNERLACRQKCVFIHAQISKQIG